MNLRFYMKTVCLFLLLGSCLYGDVSRYEQIREWYKEKYFIGGFPSDFDYLKKMKFFNRAVDNETYFQMAHRDGVMYDFLSQLEMQHRYRKRVILLSIDPTICVSGEVYKEVFFYFYKGDFLSKIFSVKEVDLPPPPLLRPVNKGRDPLFCMDGTFGPFIAVHMARYERGVYD